MVTWFLRVLRSNLLFLTPVVNLSIVLWCSLLPNFFGSCISSVTSKFQFHSGLSFYVTTRVPSSWAPILFLINGLSMLSSTITFFVNLFSLASFALSMCLRICKLPTSSLKVCQNLSLNSSDPSFTSAQIQRSTCGGVSRIMLRILSLNSRLSICILFDPQL